MFNRYVKKFHAKNAKISAKNATGITKYLTWLKNIDLYS